MNAKEIREETARVSETLVKEPAARSIFGVLGEIAAQLAEANEHLAKIANPLMEVAESPWVWLTCNGKPFVVDRSEVAGVAPLYDGIGNDRPMVHIGMKGQPWSKSADGYVKDICKKLGIPTEASNAR